MTKFIASVISRIFDFYFWFPVTLVVTLFKTGMTKEQVMILLPTLAIVDVVVPIIVFLRLLVKGTISDIDVSIRSERHFLFGFLLVVATASTALSYFLGNNLFFVLHLSGLILVLTIFLTTFYFKISGHMMLNASSIFVLNFLLGFHLWWLFLLVPLVGFARIYLKKHTLAEVLTGGVVGILEPYFVLKLFGLI